MNFESELELVTRAIQDFWENLLNQREIASIFMKGIRISEKLIKLQAILADLESR